MIRQKPKVFITRRLPKKIETRMMELFDTTLNEKDILFVKYDSVNMRYLYKCCVCSTYWKNKE